MLGERGRCMHIVIRWISLCEPICRFPFFFLTRKYHTYRLRAIFTSARVQSHRSLSFLRRTHIYRTCECGVAFAIEQHFTFIFCACQLHLHHIFPYNTFFVWSWVELCNTRMCDENMKNKTMSHIHADITYSVHMLISIIIIIHVQSGCVSVIACQAMPYIVHTIVCFITLKFYYAFNIIIS